MKRRKRENKITPAQLTRFLRVYMRQHPYTRSVEARQFGGLVDVKAVVFTSQALGVGTIKEVVLHKDEPEPPKRGGMPR